MYSHDFKKNLSVQFDDEVKELKLEIAKLKKKVSDAEKNKRQAFCDSAQQNRDKKSLLADLESARIKEKNATKEVDKHARIRKKAETRVSQIEEALQAEICSARECAAEAQSQLKKTKNDFNEYQRLYGQVRAILLDKHQKTVRNGMKQ